MYLAQHHIFQVQHLDPNNTAVESTYNFLIFDSNQNYFQHGTLSYKQLIRLFSHGR